MTAHSAYVLGQMPPNNEEAPFIRWRSSTLVAVRNLQWKHAELMPSIYINYMQIPCHIHLSDTFYEEKTYYIHEVPLLDCNPTERPCRYSTCETQCSRNGLCTKYVQYTNRPFHGNYWDTKIVDDPNGIENKSQDCGRANCVDLIYWLLTKGSNLYIYTVCICSEPVFPH